MIIYNFLHSVTLITDACHGYVEYMVKGIEVDRAKVDWYVKNSLMLVTALAPKVGYDKAAKIAHTAHVEHSSLREAALKLGFLTAKNSITGEAGEDDKTIKECSMKKAETIRVKTGAKRGRTSLSEQRPNLRKLVATITPKNRHDEADWGPGQKGEDILAPLA